MRAVRASFAGTQGPWEGEPRSSTRCWEGVFCSLLRYRANGGDELLKGLLTDAGVNATMISKTIQNQLIDIAGEIIQKKNHEQCHRVCSQ